jgi:transcriptional regulator with XRE-family HTH domain
MPRPTRKSDRTIDMEVGRRIKTHRIVTGISQAILGDAIGVSFQQVQKYEKGVNRVMPGRLQQIADRLGVQVSAFYPSMDTRATNGKGDGKSELPEFGLLQSRVSVKLLRDFNALLPNIQQHVASLVETLAANTPTRQTARKARG